VLLAEYARKRGRSAPAARCWQQRGDRRRLRYRAVRQRAVYAALTGYYSVIYASSGIERARTGAERLGRRFSCAGCPPESPAGTERRNVVLTIDPQVQKVPNDAMKRQEVSPGGGRAAAEHREILAWCPPVLRPTKLADTTPRYRRRLEQSSADNPAT